MARLPQPGGDKGSWGAVLNEFLEVEHNADGSLKPSGALAGKADATHTHAQSDVTDLEDTLDEKLDQDTADGLYAPVSHTHAQSEVTGLETALDDKVDAAEVDTLVQQAVEDHAPGIELGYAERFTSYVAGNSDMTGMSITVEGQGRPVDVEFFCSAVHHSTVGSLVRVDIKRNGTIIESAADITSNASFGRHLYGKRRIPLTDGVSYTFTVGVFQGSAGSMTWYADATRPIWLSVVSR